MSDQDKLLEESANLGKMALRKFRDGQESMFEFLSNKTIDVHVRWAVYCEIEDQLPLSQYIEHNKVLDRLYGRAWLDGDKKGKYAWSRAAESGDLCPEWDSETKTLVYNDDWYEYVEIVLSGKTGGFLWDW